MIRKGYLTRNKKQVAKNNIQISIASKLMLSLGVLILILALIYMIANFEIADSVVHLWLPFMIAGLFLVFVSQMIKWKYIRFHR